MMENENMDFQEVELVKKESKLKKGLMIGGGLLAGIAVGLLLTRKKSDNDGSGEMFDFEEVPIVGDINIVSTED